MDVEMTPQIHWHVRIRNKPDERGESQLTAVGINGAAHGIEVLHDPRQSHWQIWTIRIGSLLVYARRPLNGKLRLRRLATVVGAYSLDERHRSSRQGGETLKRRRWSEGEGWPSGHVADWHVQHLLRRESVCALVVHNEIRLERRDLLTNN